MKKMEYWIEFFFEIRYPKLSLCLWGLAFKS